MNWKLGGTMIAKVIVDIPSKSVDFKFDYLVPDHLKDFIKVGVRVVKIVRSTYYSRICYGYTTTTK